MLVRARGVPVPRDRIVQLVANWLRLEGQLITMGLVPAATLSPCTRTLKVSTCDELTKFRKSRTRPVLPS
jgi:hypothetical protein